MKKILQMSSILFVLLVASACQADTEQEADNNADESQQAAEEHESDTAGEASEEPEEESEDSTFDNEAEASYDYKEQKVIAEQIAEGDYDAVVETDNKESRVMIYEMDGEKYYKTIFVKHDSRLKIIDIHNNDGLIYNEII